MDELIEKLKSHIYWEEGMDDSLLSFYINQAKTYVMNATGKQTEYLIIMVAGIFYDYRVAEKELGQALDAMTPFFIQEVYVDEETDK
ncbi:phage gp6-like head-tail connector protein [Bacillus mycoides]|uniref:head-tail connector protein n=1 Tax=Bacillus mycoides TaxID=1405 RepID=UPI001C024E76|nr:head-tail connector protein [Bacillus mycoides]QWH11952.1 phage gp6-like head-tail connector protein [Bacillus mycoides]